MEGDRGGGHGAPPDMILTDADGAALRWASLLSAIVPSSGSSEPITIPACSKSLETNDTKPK